MDRILFISPTIPKPDMNSGDLRLYSILRILVEHYSVVFIPIDLKPDDRSYILLLEDLRVKVIEDKSSIWKIVKQEKFNIAVLEFYYTAEYYIDRIRFIQPECKIVVDSVDVHFLRLLTKYKITKKLSDREDYKETRRRELAIYRKADVVLTVTAEDANALEKESSDINTGIIPNIHEIKPSESLPHKNQLIFVGGFSHEPNVDAVKYFCKAILPLIWKTEPGVRLLIVGSNPPPDVMSFAGEKIMVTGYVPETTPYLHQSSISIAPLRFGAGMKGKIGEAMAHGIPVVTTSIGAQGMDLTDHQNIMIADSPEGFAHSVLELMKDASLYETIRNNAIKYIEKKYTPAIVSMAVNEIFKELNGKIVRRMRLVDKILLINNYLMKMMKIRAIKA